MMTPAAESETQGFDLLVPGDGKIGQPGETLGVEFNGLFAGHDGFDDRRGEEGERQDAADLGKVR